MDFTPTMNPPALPPGETAYTITRDDGSAAYAACRVERDPGAAASTYGAIAVARAIDAAGLPILNDGGNLIYDGGSASMAKTDLAPGGVLDTGKLQALRDQALRTAISAMLAELALA